MKAVVIILLIFWAIVGIALLIPESATFESQNSVEAMRERREVEQLRIAKLTPEQLVAENAERAALLEEKRLKIAADQQEIDDAQIKETQVRAARGACIITIKEQLHDPYSAEFTRSAEWYVEFNQDETILVQPKLRAKNAFGSYRFSAYNCVVKPVLKGYKIISLKEIN